MVSKPKRNNPYKAVTGRFQAQWVAAGLVLALSLGGAATGALATQSHGQNTGPAIAEKPVASPATGPTVSPSFGNIPLYFVRNDGQLDPRVEYYERGKGHAMYFAADGVYLDLAGDADAAVVKLGLRHANTTPAIVAEREQATRINHFFGNDPSKWVTDVPTFGAVLYEDVYKDIDVRFYGNNRQLEYDVIVKPGADPKTVAFAYEGVESLSVNEGGELVIALADAQIIQRHPYAYQEIDGARIEIATRFELLGDTAFGFTVANYDTAHPLIIDPVVEFATYFGGNAWEKAYDIALDAAGNIYLAGLSSSSSSFPLVGAIQSTNRGGYGDVFITKMNNAGDTVLYSTFLGGSEQDAYTLSLAVDTAGAVYVTGYTESTTSDTTPFPTTSGTLHETTAGTIGDSFVAKLSPSGDTLVYSTFLGNTYCKTQGIAVGTDGTAYVAGYTSLGDYPTTAGAFQTTHGGSNDGFVTALSPAGDALVYSTFLGGTDIDAVSGIAVDDSGVIAIVGSTRSSDFPVVNAYQPVKGSGTGLDGTDTFVAKISADGTALIFSTFFGGTYSDHGSDVAVDASGNVYFTGQTKAMPFDFPLVNAFQSVRGYTEAFVAKLSGTGDSLLFSSYLGGGSAYLTDSDVGLGIAAGDDGVVAVVGYTTSSTFNLADPFQAEITPPAGSGGWDGVEGFVAKIDTVSGTLLYSSYLGGNMQDKATAVAMDASGVVYLLGVSSSDNFPTVSPYQGLYGGGGDAILMKISGNGSADTTPPSVGSTNPVAGATSVPTSSTVTATFDEAMDPTTLDGSTFSVTGTGGGAVGGAVSYNAMIATFTPTALLAPNTLHEATITTGATDAAGNALASDHVWTFTTGAAADTTNPTVQSTSPADAATGVAVNTSVSATFDEAMDAATVTTSTFTLSASGTPVEGTVTYAAGSRTATFTPSTALNYETAHTATVTTGVSDTAGNNLASNRVWSFTTGTAPDETNPTVSSTSPTDAATGVAVNTAVTATFDEAMDATTITAASFTLTGPADTSISGAASYDPETLTATFVPASDLGGGTTYTATVTTGVADVAGNPLGADHSWEFTTIADDVDTDGDGVPDNQDDGPLDPTHATPQATTGTGKIAVHSGDSGGLFFTTLANVRTLAPSDPSLNQTGRPADMTFPDGLVSFTVKGVLDANPVTMQIWFPTPFPPGAVYYKVDSSGFHVYPYTVFTGSVLIIDLWDNGQNGDLVAGDGVIQDPGGVAVPNASSSDDDDKWWQGGCFLQILE